MLAWNKLRIEPGDGSPVEEYRIVNGHAEMHVLDSGAGGEPKGKGGWQRLTREQLTWHVMASTTVARWLQRRMGVDRLIRACAPPSYAEQLEVESRESRAT